MADAERVDLAYEADFVLGRLTVSPPRRELVRDDGVREVLEHRVMQVLIALHRAGGGIVTRDGLTRSCWEGRIVGEDAINRVISRLRKAADGIGAGSFRIETVTKIGYRLAGDGFAAPAATEAGRPSTARPTRRRFALGAAALGTVALAGGGTWLYQRAVRPTVPPEVQRLMARGWTMMHQGDHTSQTEAAGLFRRAVELAPIMPTVGDRWRSSIATPRVSIRPVRARRSSSAGARRRHGRWPSIPATDWAGQHWPLPNPYAAIGWRWNARCAMPGAIIPRTTCSSSRSASS